MPPIFSFNRDYVDEGNKENIPWRYGEDKNYNDYTWVDEGFEGQFEEGDRRELMAEEGAYGPQCEPSMVAA